MLEFGNDIAKKQYDADCADQVEDVSFFDDKIVKNKIVNINRDHLREYDQCCDTE